MSRNGKTALVAPRITVAIPTWNRSQFLRECLHSVLSQTLSDLEVYVSDNASTDDTAAVIASFNDPRLHHAPLERNIGLYPNWSRCLRLGKAPYVVVLSDDDLMLPDNLERKVRVLDENPNVGLVHSALRLEVMGMGTGKVLNHGRSEVDVIEPGPVVVRKMLTEPYWITTTSSVMRRSVVDGEIFDESDRDPADLGFALRVARKADVAYLTDPLVIGRVHAQAATVQSGILELESGDDQATPGVVALCHRVRMRFLARFGHEFPDLPELRRSCRRYGQGSALHVLKRRLGPGRSPRSSLRGFREVVAVAPSLLLTPKATRFLMASLVGPRGRELARRSARLKNRTKGQLKNALFRPTLLKASLRSDLLTRRFGKQQFDALRRHPPSQLQISRNGIKLDIPWMFAWHYLTKEYEPLTTRWLTDHLHREAVAVDVGAHLGYLTLVMARQVGSRGHVYALEPAEDNLRFLRRNVERNRASNVTILPVAAGNKSGARAFNLTGSSDSHGFYEHPLTDTKSVIQVQEARLDQIIDDPVDLVKIDVEGAELEVLAGMDGLMRRSPNLSMIVEWNPAVLRNAGCGPEDLTTYLRSQGFDICVLDEISGTRRSPDEILELLAKDSLPVSWYGNLLCERKKR